MKALLTRIRLLLQLGCETSAVLPVVLALSGVHLLCIHRGLGEVVMSTLNCERACLSTPYPQRVFGAIELGCSL